MQRGWGLILASAKMQRVGLDMCCSSNARRVGLDYVCVVSFVHVVRSED